jgi:hypothetical protein
LVYYVYLRRLQEKSSSYLGFCIIFNGIYCRNLKKLFDFFDRAFYDAQLKGELLQFEKGKCVYIISKFAEKPLEIERIKTFFKNGLESDFTRDFTNISPAFKVGNGDKTISVKENDIDILAAISKFDIVHISNNEKSLSELERTHKMLTDLYAEKQELSQKYNKLVAQKKQYKVVLFLCLIVIGCTIALFAFNKNLQSKDSQISSLNDEIIQKQDDIETLNANIVNLQIERESLTNEVSSLTNENSNLQSKNRSLQTDLKDKNKELYDLKYKYKKRPYRFYVESVDCSDYSFRITLYYGDGTNKTSPWYYRYKWYSFE